ncbi:MAG TPA: class I SAM-dependent methyltransferase [Bryobacteraceae bacterium]|jgi:SAM-dependent methyltransferase|nr:class I SAM-dependent methyltransferase [Bryobacteraceae bacterium]
MTSYCCRLCGSASGETFLDLGTVPLANSLLKPDAAADDEPRHALRVWICRDCLLVQLESSVAPEQIFSDYVYFSSMSPQTLARSERYVDCVCARLGLTSCSQVVEIGSNDGYLLRFFRQRGIPVLGIEPAANIARAAEAIGVPTKVAFFNAETALSLRDRYSADLIIANNVFAHVPDINNFVRGLTLLLKPGGTVHIEVPHLLRLIDELEFDTIYHEHVFYFSLLSVEAALSRQGLLVYDLELLPTHGGSIRVHAAHQSAGRAPSRNVLRVRQAEHDAGLNRVETYCGLSPAVAAAKMKLTGFFSTAAREGKTIAGYSASAKGISLLNYVGVEARFVDYVVDRSPHKQGLRLPGTHLPIYPPERVFETRPDYLLILSWNIKDEVMDQMSAIRAWGGKFVIPIPKLTILP